MFKKCLLNFNKHKSKLKDFNAFLFSLLLERLCNFLPEYCVNALTFCYPF